MSYRRTARKKPQQKQQTITSVGGVDDVARPAIPIAQNPPASPAIALAKQALSPVVTAAKAITTAAAAVLGPALPAIPEDATIRTAHVDDLQPGSPKSPKTTQHPFLSNIAQKLFTDDPPQQDQQQQDFHSTPHSTPTHEAPEADHPADLEADGDEQQLPATQQLPAVLRSLQHLLSSFGWKGGLLLCALVLIPLLAVVLMQGQQLKLQAEALHTQQQQVAAQAQALQDLQLQLPSLLHTAHATNNSLSTLTAEQSSLLDNLKGLSNLTQQLVQEVSHINGSQQAGEQAWQLLRAATGLDCTQQPDSAACSAEGLSAAPPNASLVLQVLRQQLSQEQQQDTEKLQLQQQVVQRQKELLQALPHTIRQEVQQQLAAQIPPLDLALADCGGHVVAISPINHTAFHQQLGVFAAAHHTSAASTKGATSMLQQLQQQLQRSLTPRPQTVSPSSVAMPAKDSPSNNTATPNSAAGGVKASKVSGLAGQQLLLLHRVLLRPASKLLPSACVPMLLGSDGSPAVIEIQLPQMSHISSVTLHAPGPVSTGSDTPGNAGTAQAGPGQLTLALVNSSSCGGPAAACTVVQAVADEGLSEKPAAQHTPSAGPSQQVAGHASTQLQTGRTMLKPGVEAALQDRLLTRASFVSGRAVVLVGAAHSPVDDTSASRPAGLESSSVLADRVVLMLFGADGASGPCMARISVQGRPSDPAGFC